MICTLASLKYTFHLSMLSPAQILAVPEKQSKGCDQGAALKCISRDQRRIQIFFAGGVIQPTPLRPLPATPYANRPMPDPNTSSSLKSDVVRHPESGGEEIQLYDHSSHASSRSSVPFSTRSYSTRSAASSTSTDRFLRRTGFSAFYYNPITQVCLLALVCFLCPGSFNALNGLGAAGRFDSVVNSNSNSAVYSTFTVTAFFAG